jgi:hypothetical protein
MLLYRFAFVCLFPGTQYNFQQNLQFFSFRLLSFCNALSMRNDIMLPFFV